MYLFFDTETTGVPEIWDAPASDLKNWPRIVQLAWVLLDENGNLIDRNSHIVLPDNYSIPVKTSELHGITTERAFREGINLKKVLSEFSEVAKLTNVLVAHNLSFDKRVIQAEYIRMRMLIPTIKEQLCTMLSTIEFCALPNQKGKGFKYPRLSELHETLFNEGFENAHNADADVNAMVRCFFELKRRKVL